VVTTEVNNDSVNVPEFQIWFALELPPDDVTRSLEIRCNELYVALKQRHDFVKDGMIQLSASLSLTLRYEDVLNFPEPNRYTNGNLAILEPALQLPKDSMYVVVGCDFF
jgi:hypothetical protein